MFAAAEVEATKKFDCISYIVMKISPSFLFAQTRKKISKERNKKIIRYIAILLFSSLPGCSRSLMMIIIKF
jgi:hypothetical protein